MSTLGKVPTGCDLDTFNKNVQGAMWVTGEVAAYWRGGGDAVKELRKNALEIRGKER